ncbi:HD domain-containing protein [Geoglobus acetivorans]|uniref:HD domain-containing protein n=1 Tax=Geoglobus acetivorans TaxID=565033 RepID=A0ABZ3H2X6_GEOAI|nr:HD domain-containing protein [Geoglobus acetivorans]
MNSDIIKKAEKFVRHVYSNKYIPGHDWLHTCRVRNLALTIADGCDINKEALEIAALFHDVGRVRSDKNHAIASAEIAMDFLKNFDLEVEFVDVVVKSIEEHERLYEPTYLEGKILQDADKLDGMGAIGIIRAAEASAFNSKLEYDTQNPFGVGCTDLEEWIDENIRQIPNRNLRVDKYLIEEIIGRQMQWINMMWTEKARRMAQRRFDLMKTFLKELEKDLREAGVVMDTMQ